MKIAVVGGGSRSALWRQILADTLEVDIVKTNVGQEAGSLGAAAVAEHLGRNRGPFDGRGADLDLAAGSHQEHLIEGEGVPLPGGLLGDLQHLVRLDPELAALQRWWLVVAGVAGAGVVWLLRTSGVAILRRYRIE